LTGKRLYSVVHGIRGTAKPIRPLAHTSYSIPPEAFTSTLAFVFKHSISNNTSVVTYLRKHALGAKLDEGLFRVMQSGEGREALLS